MLYVVLPWFLRGFLKLRLRWPIIFSEKQRNWLKILMYMIKDVLNVPKLSITNFRQKSKLRSFAFAWQYRQPQYAKRDSSPKILSLITHDVPNPYDLHASSEHKLRYFWWNPKAFWPCIDSNRTTTFKAQKRSKDIIKIVRRSDVEHTCAVGNAHACVVVMLWTHVNVWHGREESIE